MNLYAYCLNNPVMYIDYNGSLPKFIEKLITIYNNIRNDVINFDFKNTDEQKVFDSNYFSAYKGHLVLRHGSKKLTSWAFLGIIFLNYDDEEEEDLKHEYGHILQEKELGTLAYIDKVAIPSIFLNYLSRSDTWFLDNYYNFPWEYDADMRGGVDRKNYSPYAKEGAYEYWSEYWSEYKKRIKFIRSYRHFNYT